MPGINSLLFLKVLCDLEIQKIETIPDDAFSLDVSASNNQPTAKTTPQSFVKIYMQKEYGIGGSYGSKRYACQKCSCLFRRKRHLRLHLQFLCNHKCLGCSECYANIHNLYNSLGEENPEPVKAFTCSTCPSSFLTHGGLAVHEECHPQPGKILECESCFLKFNSRLKFNQHQKTHVTLVRYNCMRCSKVFSSLSNLAKHVRVKHQAHVADLGNNFLIQPYQDSCNDEQLERSIDKDEKDKQDKKQSHSRRHSKIVKRRMCALCHQRFQTVHLLKMHVCPDFPSLDEIDKVSSIQCPACSETYSSLVALKLHCETHTSAEPLMCTFCDKKLSSVRKAHEHFEYHGRSSCNKCGVLFRTKLTRLLHHCGFTQRCFVCDQVFPTQIAFKRHQLVHPPPKDVIYKCLECKKTFAKESYFRAHQMKHTGKQPFCCSLCDQKFVSYGPFKKHITCHLAYDCNSCNKRFGAAKTLKRHLKTHHNSKCENAEPVKAEELTEEHIVSAKEELSIEPFALPKEVSIEQFASPKEEPPEEPVLVDEGQPEELSFPLEEEPTSISGFSCHICNQVFRRQHQLFLHLRGSHGKAPPYLFHCDLCSRGFYHRLHLNAHKVYCSRKNDEEREELSRKREKTKEYSFAERKLKCPECDKRYFSQPHLIRHMYVHRDASEYPHHCPLCGVGYIREFSFKVHVEKCNGPDPHCVKNPLKCKVCGATFVDKKRLNRHLAAHDNPWECPNCKEKFLTEKGWVYHKKRCTPEDAKYKTFRKPKKAPTVYTCPTCERTFILRDRYEAHVESHDGIMRFQCPTCYTRFMSINNFKRHRCKLKPESAEAKVLQSNS